MDAPGCGRWPYPGYTGCGHNGAVPRSRPRIADVERRPIVSIRNLGKTYASGFRALDDVSLDIRRGEIFALLGPNGAGKTTLINIVCGIVNASSGSVLVDGHDIVREARAARMQIGLVPQELSTDAFESVGHAALQPRPVRPAAQSGVSGESAALAVAVGQARQQDHGPVRRHEAARADRQALSHEPRILFLDEPTAGVDVELRREMWQLVRELRESGVTIILTTHYIEEAEEMADRIGVIRKGPAGGGRGQARADAQARQEAADPAVAGAAAARSRGTRRRAAGTGRRRPLAGLHLRRAGRTQRHRDVAAPPRRPRHRLQGPAFERKLAGGDLRQPGACRSAKALPSGEGDKP